MIKQAEEAVQAEQSEYCKIFQEYSENLYKIFTSGGVLQVPLPNCKIPATCQIEQQLYNDIMAQQVMLCKNH